MHRSAALGGGVGHEMVVPSGNDQRSVSPNTQRADGVASIDLADVHGLTAELSRH